MSGKEDDVMEVDNKEEKEKEKQKDESEDDGEEEEEEEEEEETPKRRTPKTLAEKRLSRLSSGMEMRGMMTESYPCKECSASFSRKSKLDYHVANVHPKQPVIPIEEKSPGKRGRKPKTPKKIEKSEKPEKSPKTLTPEVKKKVGSGHQAEVQRAIQKQLLQQQQQHQLLQHQQQLQQLQERQLQQQQSQAIIFQNKQQSKLPKVTNISNEKVKYNWGYYCTACDMYFANMFAQQFHCLHGQAKFRCEACCICFKLRKNFMSHVQMVHGVDIPEEVLARMRPRSEIRAKQEADAEKNGQKKEESEPVDLTNDGSNSSNEKPTKLEVETGKLNSDESGKSESKQPTSETHENGLIEPVKSDDNETAKSDANESAKSDPDETVKSDANETAKSDGNEHSSAEQAQDGENKVEVVKSKDNTSEEPEIICITDSPAKKGKVLQLKAVTDVKQSESGGNSSADESDKKDEGRVYLTTVRMGNTYVTLPSGEKWMIECLRCHQAFFKMEDASVHMKQRPGSHFSCPHCHYSSTLYSQCDYEIHRLRTHSFPCAQCRQSFILECQRDMHEQKIHNYFRQLMRRKHPPGASGKAPPSGTLVKSAAGTNSGNNTRTIVIASEGGSSSSKGAPKSVINRDGYPVVRTQRTPYVCLMCDRDCYTRDALDHHKKTFHSAVYRPAGKITHPISKSSITYKTNRFPTGSISRNAPVSKILQEMRQGPDHKSANRTIAALQDPYLEPNKIPHAYISRIKVDLPDANKLVDTIRNELLKGPTNFSMPNYAKPSKFNKDMVTNPAVVKLSREVAYKLYFDLQGPCNESDKMNYKEPEKVLYKIPMGCHSHKLKDVPLFPTLDDLIFRTQNYTVPPLNTIAPVELFNGFQGGLSMKDSINFSQELDNCMFGCFTKTMRALTMIYSSRRVAVSEGFWRLQTKALIAILKEVEEQRKKEIGERAKAASVAAKAAAAAAASARPLKLKDYPQTIDPGSHVLLPNGGTLEQTSCQPMIQLVGNKVPGTSDESVPDVVLVSADSSKERSHSSPGSTHSSVINDQSKAETSKASSTSVDKSEIPTLQALAKRAADDKDEKQDEEEESKEGEIKEKERKHEGEEKNKDGEKEEEDEDEPKKKKRKTQNGDDNDEEEVLVNGSASPPPGEENGPAMNGMQNGPSEGGNPPNNKSSSESKVSQISVTDASQKGTKLSSAEGTTTAPTEPANNLTNGTLHAQLNGGTFQLPINGTTFQVPLNGGSIHTALNGGTIQTPVNGGTINAPLSGVATSVFGGNNLFNLNLSSGQLSLLNGIPVQIKTAGNMGGNRLGNGVVQLGNGIGTGVAGGTVISGIRGVGNGFVSGGGGGGGSGVLLSVPHSNVQLMPVPKLAYSVGAVSAVASVQNIPSLQVRQKPITLAVHNNAFASPLLSKQIVRNPTITLSPINKPAVTKPTKVKPSITKLGNGVIPEKIAKFISQNFINIKPKQPEASPIPVKGEPLPTLLKVKNLAASVKADPKVDELIKVCKLTSPSGQSTVAAGNSNAEEFVLTRILESIAILKQLQTSKFLPEALCEKITPLCEKIVQASTTMEDKEDLSREVDSILKTEAKEAMKLFNQETDLNDNNSDQFMVADGGGQDARAVDQFLQSLAKRIKCIQSRLTARSIDPISMAEIVPLCQDICDPKLTLTKKVHVIKEIEDKIKAYETEARSQAATPVDIAAVPEEIEVDEDACVYFKLQLDNGSSVMVSMNDLEDAYQAISDLARLNVRVKRMYQKDVNREKRKLKRKKIEADEDKAGKGEPMSNATPKASPSGTKKRKSPSRDATSSKKKK